MAASASSATVHVLANAGPSIGALSFAAVIDSKDRCCLKQPVVPVHDDRVRPYRPMPIFRPDTLVQHYLQPAEMVPFYKQVKVAFSRSPIVRCRPARIGSWSSLCHSQ